MTDFLTKLFIKEHDNPQNQLVREKYGTFTSIVGIIVNIILASFKLIVGILGASIAIIADALNNFSDAGSSIVSLVSFKIAAKPADRDHPFGHARIEYVCSMIVSFLILIMGFELIKESIGGFFNPLSTKNTTTELTYIVLVVSVIMKLWLAFFYKKIGKKINSSVISASSTDSILDAISTLAVLASSIIIAFTGWWIVDSIVGIAVSVMIIIAGIKVLNETKNSLLGEAPLSDVVESIKSTVAKYKDIVGIHDMMVHNYGPNHYIASFHAEVDGKEDIYMLHDTIDNIEREINDELGILCTIHMDPIVTDDEDVNVLRKTVGQTVSAICEGATIHDFRTVIGHTHTNLIFDIALPFESKVSTDALIESVRSEISKINPTYYCIITVDRE